MPPKSAASKFCLSTLSINTIEEVAGACEKPIWYQLYVFKDRAFARQMIERAKAAGVSVLFLTVDLPYRGQRHADIKNGLVVPPRMTMRNAWDMTTKVHWWKSLIGKRHSFGNLETYLRWLHRPGEAGLVGVAQFRPESQLARPRLDSRAVGRQDRAQRHSRCGRCQARRIGSR